MRRSIIIASTAALAMFASLGYALGFGEIQLQSALNQPLKASIPLLAVKPEERDEVSVDVASVETFKRFGIDRPAILDQIDISVVPGASSTSLRVLVNSRVPIQEPFLTFLLEANWPDGRAIREYTVLLDPPIDPPTVSAWPAPAPVQAVRPAQPEPLPTKTAPPAPKPTAKLPPPAQPQAPQTTTSAPDDVEYIWPERQPVYQAPAAATRPPTAKAANPAPVNKRTYGPVAAKETLWSIANRTRPTGVTQSQMMLALYQQNLEDFEGNINLIRKGAVLEIPSKDEVLALNVLAAKAEVRDQQRAYEKQKSKAPNISANSADITKAVNENKPSDKAELKLEPATTNTSSADNDVKSATGSKVDEAAPAGKPADAELSEQETNENTPATNEKDEIGDLITADKQAQTPSKNNSTPDSETSIESTKAQQTEPSTANGQPKQTLDTPQSPADAADTETEDYELTARANDELNALAQELGTEQSTSELDNSGSVAQSNAESNDGADSPTVSTEADSLDKQNTATSQAEQTAADDQLPSDATEILTPEDITPQSSDVSDTDPSADNAAVAQAEKPEPTAAASPAAPSPPVANDGNTPLTGASAWVTPQRLLLVLGLLLLVVALLMLWNRSRYKAVPADFTLDPDDTDADSDVTNTATQREVEANKAGDSKALYTSASAGAGVAGIAAASDLPQEPPPSVDELLTDADSLIENELYDEALAALTLGLDSYPENAALQRKVLEVHHSAGESSAFLSRVDDYYPQGPEDNDANWHVVAAMGRDFAPNDPRFQTSAAASDNVADEQALENAFVSSAEPQTNVADEQADEDFGSDDNLDIFAEPQDPITQAPTTTPTDPAVADDVAPAASTPPTGANEGAAEIDISQIADSYDFETDKEPEHKPEPVSQPPVCQDSDSIDGSDKDEDSIDLSSDFDLSAFDSVLESDASEPNQTPDKSTPNTSDASDSLDFDIVELEIDSETPAPNQATPAAAAPPAQGQASETDLEWSEGLSLTEDDLTNAGSVDTDESESHTSELLDDKDSSLTQVETASSTDNSSEGNITRDTDNDLNDNSGSLAGVTQAAASPSLETASDTGDAESGNESEPGVTDEEVTTKLDLARAYIDMGEPEMAQALLEDVRAQGNDGQQREAISLLQRIG